MKRTIEGLDAKWGPSVLDAGFSGFERYDRMTVRTVGYADRDPDALREVQLEMYRASAEDGDTVYFVVGYTRRPGGDWAVSSVDNHENYRSARAAVDARLREEKEGAATVLRNPKTTVLWGAP